MPGRTSLKRALTLCVLVSGCATAAPPLSPAPEIPVIRGRVLFPGYKVAVTTMQDVAFSATVSIIDTVTNVSVGATLSDTEGNFALRPDAIPANRLYYLEAVKGLTGNSAGRDAARVRTMVKFVGGIWDSLTGVNNITVSRATTAVSALVSLKNVSAVEQESLLGKVGTEGTPPSFDASAGIVTADEYTQTFDFVTTALAGDRDPVDSLQWDALKKTVYLRDGVGPQPPLLLDAYPNPAAVGETVYIVGKAFNPDPGSNSIDFNGSSATVTNALPDRLEVKVPAGATTGLLTVTTVEGANSLNFRVMPRVPGKFLGP